MQFTVLDSSSGQPSNASPPSLGNPDTQRGLYNRGIPGYQIVNGQVAGVFLQFFVRAAAGHGFLPGGGTQYNSFQPMFGMTYLGSAYDFVIMPSSTEREVSTGNEGRDLIRVNTNSQDPGFDQRVDYDSMIVARSEPKNLNCVPVIDGLGDYLVYAAYTKTASETFCSDGNGNFNTLAVQVIDRETLQARWTTSISGDFSSEEDRRAFSVGEGPIAVTSRNGKVYVVATMKNGSVRLAELDGNTGAVGYTRDTTRASGDPEHAVHAVHVLSSGTIAMTGAFGESPVMFYGNGGFISGTDSCN